MKAVKYLLLGLIAAALLAGCGKQPTQDIDAAKAAVDTVAVDAEKFAPEDAKVIKDSLQAAMDEVKTQDGKTFKNYDKAKDMLTKVKSDADALKTAIPQKKEAAKNNAISAQDAAKTAAEEAKKLLAKAPKGKGSKADIEAMKADIKGVEESLGEVQKLIEGENYGEAINKANAAKEKADSITEQVKQAREKAGKK
ncbi:MAG TPA: hypothetical protein DD713_05655 [Nitrospiraceae bacterium]|nr:hypothetical protein [Nitrospiraceae bacterium]